MRMRKSTGIFLLLFWAGLVANGQINLTIMEPPSGIVTKAQLWNLNLGYTGTEPLTVYIGLNLFDVNDNHPVFTATTRTFILQKGVKQLKSAELMPIDYKFLSAAVNPAVVTGGFLPVGQYRACYSVIQTGRDFQPVLAEDCISLEIMPLSPPVLQFPADTSVLKEQMPTFSWLPPVPISLFSDLNYEIRITEVLFGQAPGMAITENLPVISKGRLLQPLYNYSNMSKSLDTGKVYAWQVIARNGDVFTAKSDVWTFRIGGPDKLAEKLKGQVFYELKATGAGINTAIITERQIGVSFYSYDKAHEQTVSIFDSKGVQVSMQAYPLQYGANQWYLKLNNQIREQERYRILITDLEGNEYELFFFLATKK